MTIELVGVHNLTRVANEELLKLLAEMRPLNFKSSKELSAYIVEHQLGHKYPSISGTIKMKDDETEWDLKGGFHPDTYKIICSELGLKSKGTKAQVTGFTPFNVSTKPIKRVKGEASN
jgi:hypothetical protein